MQTVVVADEAAPGLAPLTDTRPRATLPVADRPLVAHALDAAAAAGATGFLVVVDDRAETVEAAIGEDHAGVPVEFVRREGDARASDPLGGAIDRLDPAPFAVLDGGSLFDARSLCELYRSGPAVVGGPDGDHAGRVLRTAPGGSVVGADRTVEPEGELVPAGAYALPAAAVDRAAGSARRGEGGLPELLARTTPRSEVRSVDPDRHRPVRRPWDLLAANDWKLEAIPGGPVAAGSVSSRASLSGTVVVEEGARVEPGSVLEGPVLVREGATVGPNAYVRGASLVGPGARVGHAVEVENSVLMRGATVGRLSYVGDSVLGRDVRFGAGTVTATRRHDGRPVRVTVGGDPVPTGRRTFGVVAGDGARTGATTGIDAGVTLSTGARTGVGERVLSDR